MCRAANPPQAGKGRLSKTDFNELSCFSHPPVSGPCLGTRTGCTSPSSRRSDCQSPAPLGLHSAGGGGGRGGGGGGLSFFEGQGKARQDIRL